jgi:hypothetical protein
MLYFIVLYINFFKWKKEKKYSHVLAEWPKKNSDKKNPNICGIFLFKKMVIHRWIYYFYYPCPTCFVHVCQTYSISIRRCHFHWFFFSSFNFILWACNDILILYLFWLFEDYVTRLKFDSLYRVRFENFLSNFLSGEFFLKCLVRF